MAETALNRLSNYLPGTSAPLWRSKMGCAYRPASPRANNVIANGMTLIELTIVMAVMAILLAVAIPSYTKHSLRVHRSEAIQRLLQIATCQEHILARTGSYDSSQCIPATSQQRYDFSYLIDSSHALGYIAIASPLGAQLRDACGVLLLDQSGARRIAATGVSASKCWSGR